MPKQKKTRLQSAINALAIFLPALFIAYCLIYLCACPSPQLAVAVGVELVALLISIVIIHANIFSIPQWLLEKIPESIRLKFESMINKIDLCKVVVLSIISILGVVDFAALSLSIAGWSVAASFLYRVVPSSYIIGLHPAFSLEMLAGALVEKQDFTRAEPLYLEILDIRTKLCGPNSDLASAIYADLGDFYVRKHDLSGAEKWYRRSVAIGPRTGRGFTALATVLREQGKFAESEGYYLKALELRKIVFGVNSRQYNDTERGYMKLQQLTGSRTKNL